MRNGDATVASPSEIDAVPTLARRTEDEARHLQDQHQLRPVVAWVKAPSGPDNAAPPRSASAARMARSRAKKTAAGLITCYVPVALIEEVKAAGGWEAWRRRANPSVDPPSSLQGERERTGSTGSALPSNGLRALCIRWLTRLLALIEAGPSRTSASTPQKKETSC